MNSLIEKLRKLQTLSERGEGGEARNATKLLYQLMEKYSISLDEISSETPKRQYYNHKGIYQQFVVQIIASEIGHFSYHRSIGKGKKSEMSFVCTDSEFKFIVAKVDYYWKLLKEEEKLFYKAFIQSNSLYSKPSENDVQQKFTQKEIDEFWKIMKMAATIGPKPMNKLIENE